MVLPPYAELHCLTNFSFLRGASHPEELVERARALGYSALAVTDEDAFRLKQGRSIVLVPRQVETVKARLTPGSRTVSAMSGGVVVALCEMRAGRLEPSRVFHLEKSGD